MSKANVARAIPVEGFSGVYDVEFVEGGRFIGEIELVSEESLDSFRRDGWDVRVEVST